MRRVAIPASIAAAILVLAVACVWIVQAHDVAAGVSAQARVARALLDERVPLGEALAGSLVRPGLHVLIADGDAETVIDAGSDGVVTRPFPPGGFAGPGVFAGPPPPGSDALVPGAPGMPGGVAGTFELRPGPTASLARSLLHVAPQSVVRGDRTIVVEPDVPVLARWLTIDAIALVAGLLLVAVSAAIRATLLDRADRRALEARVAERRDAAERYQRFLAETGHELRTPLTVLSGYVDILRARRAGDPIEERILDGMYAETSRMRVLVEKMLTLARLETQVAVPRLVDVATAATEAAQLVRHRYPGRSVLVKPDQTASIIIDADDYAAALGNVLENAIKFAPGSPIVVETSVENGRAVTAVVDHGPGIAAGEREAIFERFYRGREREHGGGVGLGLAIVKRIADRWQGTAICESGDGRTTFRLAFPIADEETYGVAR
jgi:signal transduction histidine kinase